MSLLNTLKRPHNDDDENDVVVKVEEKKDIEESSKISHASKRIKRKHEIQIETAAAMLQDSLVHLDSLNKKTSVEVLKVAVTTTKKLLVENPNILENLSDEQCKVLIHMSRTILKNRRCKALKRELQKRKQTKTGSWWKWFWPI